MNKNRLWRVDLTHKMGYQAPSLYVETTTYERPKAELEALNLAKKLTRLSDFPNVWHIEVVCTERKQYNNKWLSIPEINNLRVV